MSTTDNDLIQIHISHENPLLVFKNHNLLTHLTRGYVTNKPYWHTHFTFAYDQPQTGPTPENALSNAAYPLRLYISPTYTALLLLGRPLNCIQTFELDARASLSRPSIRMGTNKPLHPDIRDTLLSLGVELTIYTPQTDIEEITFK